MPGYEVVGKEELEELRMLFDRGQGNIYRYGPRNFAVREFEKEFARFMGVNHAHAVSSGTAAIHCALAGAGIQAGDEVITTSFTFVAPIEAILAVGATPVPVDIDETYHLDPVEVEKAITPKTRAIVSIPMWAPPKMAELQAIAEKHKLILIEDSAQCLGGSYRGQKLGTFGKVASFSFDMGKTITTGEGGMVITQDKEIYDRVAEYSDHGHMHVEGLPRGQDPRRMPGLNYRMSELSGAIGLAQLRKIPDLLEKHRENKKRLKEAISGTTGLEFRSFSDEAGSLGDTLIFQLGSKEKAAEVAKKLQSNGFSSKILPEAFDWHFAGAWTHIFGGTREELSARWNRTHQLLLRSVALPIHYKLTIEGAEKLARAVREAVVG